MKQEEKKQETVKSTLPQADSSLEASLDAEIVCSAEFSQGCVNEEL